MFQGFLIHEDAVDTVLKALNGIVPSFLGICLFFAVVDSKRYFACLGLVINLFFCKAGSKIRVGHVGIVLRYSGIGYRQD